MHGRYIGRKTSKETKRKQSIATKGKSRAKNAVEKTAKANTGRKNSKESIENIKNATIIAMSKLPQEIRSKLSNNMRRAIISIDKLNNELKFNSIVEAAKILNLSENGIRDTLRGRQRAHQGYTFKYLNKEDE